MVPDSELGATYKWDEKVLGMNQSVLKEHPEPPAPIPLIETDWAGIDALC